jgi:hypothetical protein
MDAEACYVLSLLKRGGEADQAVIDRFWRVGLIGLDEIQVPRRRELLALIQQNMADDRPTSVQLASHVVGVDLEPLVQAVDPDGVDVYAREMVRQRKSGRIRQTLDEALKEQDPDQVVLQIQRELAEIRHRDEDERITPLPQAGKNFLAWLGRQQELMTSGVPRVSFHWRQLDDMVPYLFPGNVILLTAKTKRGKSSFAGDWFDWMLRRGFRGLYFHFEDPPEVMGLKRMARLMGLDAYDEDGEHIGIPFIKMLTGILTLEEIALCDTLDKRALEWTECGTQVYCVNWHMEQVIRVWQREHFRKPVDFVVVDYLNKAALSSHDVRYRGVFEARGRDSGLVKDTAETTGGVAVLVQQEGDDGKPYETRQAMHKSQVHLSLRRERLSDDQGRMLSPDGKVCVMNANLGQTGDVEAQFLKNWMMWEPR